MARSTFVTVEIDKIQTITGAVVKHCFLFHYHDLSDSFAASVGTTRLYLVAVSLFSSFAKIVTQLN